jgi:iron complex transport system substrate-binding protein
VCAVDVSVVDDALDYLGCTADVLTIDPHTLSEVVDSIRVLGRATARLEEADRLATSLESRLDQVRRRVSGARPRTLVLEWTDPPFAPGHWVPEMVGLAGGACVLGTPGEKSFRVDWEKVRAADPDVVVCAPCGYGLEQSAALAERLVTDDVLPPGVPVWAVDANASFARPGPRLVDGVEALAAVLHPATFGQPPANMARLVSPGR